MADEHNKPDLADIYSKLNELTLTVNTIKVFMQGVQNIPGSAPACVIHEQRIKACEDSLNKIIEENSKSQAANEAYQKEMEKKIAKTKNTIGIIVAVPTIVIGTIKVLEFFGKITP